MGSTINLPSRPIRWRKRYQIVFQDIPIKGEIPRVCVLGRGVNRKYVACWHGRYIVLRPKPDRRSKSRKISRRRG